MTNWRRAFDRVQSTSEWILIVLMLAAAIWLIIDIPNALERVATGAVQVGPVQQAFGAVGASVTYATVWTVEAILLAYAKIKDKARLRKWTMFAIFVTHTFTFVLSWNLRGIGLHLIDNFLIVSMSAWLWIRAKLQYDYVEWEELNRFDED